MRILSYKSAVVKLQFDQAPEKMQDFGAALKAAGRDDACPGAEHALGRSQILPSVGESAHT
jgi:hypothetical protein